MEFNPTKQYSIKHNIDFGAVEQKIKEARKHSLDFSELLKTNKHKEQGELNSMQNERNHWLESYEEKAVMIEQLQRELASTVDALQSERRSHREHDTSTRSSAELDGTVNSFNKTQNNISSSNKPTLGDQYGINNQANFDKLPSVDQSFSTAQLDRVSGDAELLNQLLSQARADAAVHREKLIESNLRQEELACEVESVRREMDRAKAAWREAEGKLQFRTSQVSVTV
jgi:hypothetical protein